MHGVTMKDIYIVTAILLQSVGKFYHCNEERKLYR